MPTLRNVCTPVVSLALMVLPAAALAQQAGDSGAVKLLIPDAVWDGLSDQPARGWAVVVRG